MNRSVLIILINSIQLTQPKYHKIVFDLVYLLK